MSCAHAAIMAIIMTINILVGNEQVAAATRPTWRVQALGVTSGLVRRQRRQGNPRLDP
jgi:hypothetical protein